MDHQDLMACGLSLEWKRKGGAWGFVCLFSVCGFDWVVPPPPRCFCCCKFSIGNMMLAGFLCNTEFVYRGALICTCLDSSTCLSNIGKKHQKPVRAIN